ncbi:hypothetical protein ADIAL_1520 [Alkalibacterium sp. AK22]|uniref:hypothetical protein n=1 Tax=Alkalibacterium sp. AK22 TaxID=1229520 RepID=UPI00044A59D0|nr:hypothetical protein [Alkalibacterium sp. AK22]EXJ23058.1 hypothetical protein ADIAL_1520 [Alkalibacterium sp. AK22]
MDQKELLKERKAYKSAHKAVMFFTIGIALFRQLQGEYVSELMAVINIHILLLLWYTQTREGRLTARLTVIALGIFMLYVFLIQ